MKNKKSKFVDLTSLPKKFLYIVPVVVLVLIVLAFLFIKQNSNSNYAFKAERGFSSVSADMAAPTLSVNVNNDQYAIDRKIVKNGYLRLVVKNTKQTAQDASVLAENFGGYVENLNIYESGENSLLADISIRVPESSFVQLFDNLKILAVKVENESVNSRDVTESYVDIEARLNNLKATEEQYLNLLERANDVEEVLLVQKELSNTRENIERLQAQFDLLSRDIDLSVINLSLISESDAKIFGIVWSPVNQIKQGINDLINDLIGLVNGLIKLVFWLPILLIWLVIIGLLVWGGYKGGILIWQRIKR